MDKKYLFYFGSCFGQKFMGQLLDKAMSLAIDKNNKVLFAYCGGINELCTHNLRGSKPMCRLCYSCTKAILKKYNIESVALYDYKSDNTVTFEYSSSDELKQITYRDVCIGLSIMSCYISLTRNMNPSLNGDNRKYFDAHLQQNVRFVDALYRLIEDYRPNEIIGYNGRFEDDRPAYDIAIKLKIPISLVEDVVVDGQSHRIFYQNNLPHSIEGNRKLREYCWSNYHLELEEKISLGKSFFEKRRSGLPSGDKIYIGSQKADLVPKFDKTKINVAIMNSSEDEFASVGGEWEKLKLFHTQYEGIIFLLENASKDVHFYLRIHPNLKDVPYSYHTKLLRLSEKYDNITVIPGDSPMSTYGIMDNVDIVVSFGSTMGIESSFWGKPSIVLGPCHYYGDKVAYTPKSKEEILTLLRKDLSPLYNDNLVKFGAYILDKSPLYDDAKFLDWNVHQKSFLGYKYYYTNFFNLCISPKLTAFLLGCVRFLQNIFNRYDIPVEENTEQ